MKVKDFHWRSYTRIGAILGIFLFIALIFFQISNQSIKNIKKLHVEIDHIGKELMDSLLVENQENLQTLADRIAQILTSEGFIEMTGNDEQTLIPLGQDDSQITKVEFKNQIIQAYNYIHNTNENYFWRILNVYYSHLWLGFILLAALGIFLISIPFSNHILLSTRQIQSLYYSQSLNLLEKKLNIISYDLHDDIIQKLAVINRYLEEDLIKHPLKNKIYLDYSKDIIDKIRIISNDLKTPDNQLIADFDEALEKLFADFTFYSSQNLHIKKIGIKVLNWDYENSIHFYRVLQESLNNIHKHSQAKNVFISIIYSCPVISVDIRDDGVGFDLQNPSHRGSGLDSIKYRLELLNAKFKLSSVLGEGTSLNIKIRIENENIDGSRRPQHYFPGNRIEIKGTL